MEQTGRVAQTHGVDAAWIFATLEQHLKAESNGTNWWGSVLLPDGRIIEKYWPEGRSLFMLNNLYLLQRAYANDILKFLNAQCAHGGVWIVAWLDEFRRFYLCWRDGDGDIQIPIECDRSWQAIQSWDVEVWAEHAEQAYSAWREHMKTLDLSRGQLKKVAQGERSR